MIDLDPATSSVIVGDAEDLVCDEFEMDHVNWLDADPLDEPREINVKIRYAHAGAEATISQGEKGAARIRLHEAAARGDAGTGGGLLRWRRVLGGGWICRQQAAVAAFT